MYREIIMQGNQSREIKVQGNQSIGKVKSMEIKVYNTMRTNIPKELVQLISNKL